MALPSGKVVSGDLSGTRVKIECTGKITNFKRLRDHHGCRPRHFTSTGSSILLAERWGFKSLDPLLGLDHAKVSGAPIP
jgi:hypothetical protein